MSEATDRKTQTYSFLLGMAMRLEKATTVSEQLDVVVWALEYKRAWGSERMSVTADRILAQLKADLGMVQ